MDDVRSGKKYATLAEVLERFNTSSATLKRLVAKGHFPAPVKLSPMSPRIWLISELDAYEEGLLIERGKPPRKTGQRLATDNLPAPKPKPPKDNSTILRLPEVISLSGLSRSSIYILLKDGEFPAPMKLSKRLRGWLQSDIDRWIASRAR